jgi:predicted dehydrogenase
MTIKAPVRLAVIGGRRGGSSIKGLHALADKIRLTAVCDINEAMLANWTEKNPELKAYTSYEKLLEDPDIDAVLLATPLFIHARQAIQALNAGKHVLSEVIAAHTLDDCWELVETVERTGLTYMLSENFCYMRPNMMVQNMIQNGVFGQITHVEGAYLHDVRKLTHYADGSLTWRGELHKQYNGMNYPTHSLGPLGKWLNIGREGGDQFDYMTTFTSANAALRKYYKEHVGENHPGAVDESFWKQGDSATTLIRTKKGTVITLRVDWVSGRPHNMSHYGLQGTHGAYLSGRYKEEDPLIWIEGRSPGYPEGLPDRPHAKWESLWNFADEYEHPLWKTWMETAKTTGHGGGDFFTILEFADAVLENRRPAIDVYDAVNWSCVFPLSMQSVAEQGKPISFPDFNSKKRGS